MSVVVLTLIAATTLVALGLLAAMYVKDKPWYGAIALGLLLAPVTILAFTYLVVAA
jgi:hypothetical protein